MSRWESGRNGRLPDRLVMEVPGLEPPMAHILARDAVALAAKYAPKLSGISARRLEPVWGDGYFGVRWQDHHVWFQEAGIKAFTMKHLAGKVIPMWIDDPTGTEKAKNPNAKTRVTESGRHQVLIFRRAAKQGERRPDGKPASYPGAPGRIWTREARAPLTTAGRRGGAIATRNVGVRWRHPGLAERSFVWKSLLQVAAHHGIPEGEVYAMDRGL